MQTVLYLLFIVFIIGLVFSLLPIILPIVLIIIIVASVYVWRLKKKIVQHMEEYSDDVNSNFQEERNYQTFQNHTTKQEDVIDVEFSEREDLGE